MQYLEAEEVPKLDILIVVQYLNTELRKLEIILGVKFMITTIDGLVFLILSMTLQKFGRPHKSSYYSTFVDTLI